MQPGTRSNLGNSELLNTPRCTPEEMCKDVTALANSAGGQLVYGIEEDKPTKKRSRVDDGVADPKITREWIEQILNSRVQPRLSGVTTTCIDMENGQFGYVLTVRPTQTGPHQAPDQKYYRRFDLQSVPMHDYEIKDIMRRASTPHLEVLASFWGTGSPTEALMTRSSEESRRAHPHRVCRFKQGQPAS
jgi:predicted HTH transcriptional regulator